MSIDSTEIGALWKQPTSGTKELQKGVRKEPKARVRFSIRLQSIRRAEQSEAKQRRVFPPTTFVFCYHSSIASPLKSGKVSRTR